MSAPLFSLLISPRQLHFFCLAASSLVAITVDMSGSPEPDVEAGASSRRVRRIVRTSFPTQANALLRKNLTYQVSASLNILVDCKWLEKVT